MFWPRALHYTATLIVISLLSPSEKPKIVYFRSHAFVWASNSPATGCVSEMLVVPQPIGVRVLTSWPIVAFGSIPALMHHFWWDNFHFQSFQIAMPKREAESELPGDESHQEKRTPKFSGRVRYRTGSVHCTINAERQACEVQRLLLQFLVECTASNNTSAWSVTSTKEKREEVHWRFPINFYGLWHNLSGDAFHKFLCSAQYRSLCSRSWHLFWRTFLQKRIAKEDHICTLRSKCNYYT